MNDLIILTVALQSCAWPITVIILVLLLRPTLEGIIPFIQRFKWRDFELEFGEKVEEVRAELLSAPEIEVDIIPGEVPSPAEERIIKLAEISPRFAVMEGWRNLENGLLRAAARQTEPDVKKTIHVRDAIMILQGKELISPITSEVIDQMRRLRNQAAHAPKFAVASSSAIEFGLLANKLAMEISAK